RLQAWPLPRTTGGGPLLYQNCRRRMWAPVFKRLGLLYVTPHSARDLFISTMQAQGIEVGLVAKLAGRASEVATLGPYSQAVRGGAAAVAALKGIRHGVDSERLVAQAKPRWAGAIRPNSLLRRSTSPDYSL